MRSNRIRTTALAATALLAALSLTACGGADSNGKSDNGKAGASAPAANTAVEQTASTSAAPDKDGTDAETDTGAQAGDTSNSTTPTAARSGMGTTGGTGSSGSTGNTANTANTKSGKTVTCEGSNTKTSVSKVTRPINHLLLTLTNTGKHTCYAYYAPKLRFDDAQAVFRILEDSQPQAVVTLDPGQSAYAAIGLVGEPGDGPAPRESKHLQVNFSGRNPQGSTGTPAQLKLPAHTFWDDNGFVTYWQAEMADALTY